MFEEMALYRPNGLNLTGGGEPEKSQVIQVSASYLPMLGLSPALGRWFVEARVASRSSAIPCGADVSPVTLVRLAERSP